MDSMILGLQEIQNSYGNEYIELLTTLAVTVAPTTSAPTFSPSLLTASTWRAGRDKKAKSVVDAIWRIC